MDNIVNKNFIPFPVACEQCGLDMCDCDSIDVWWFVELES